MPAAAGGAVGDLTDGFCPRPTSRSRGDAGTAIRFAGSASDTEDGDLTAGLGWSSSLDGAIGTGGAPSAVLSVGTHTVSASVTDSERGAG